MRVDPASCIESGARIIREHGEGLPVEELIRGQRVATRLEGRSTGDDPLMPGTSRLGGLPDLPPSFDWPKWSGKPESGPSRLAFLAQLNLAEVADGTGLLPERGWLYFFYDAVQQPWGFDPRHSGCARVLYFDGEASALRRASAPADLSADAVFPAHQVHTELTTTLPHWASELGLDLPEGRLDDYWDLIESYLPGPRPQHQLLGWPKQIQGEMERECQLVTHGIYCGNPSGYASPEAKRLEAGASDWILLLQLDSDEGPDWMWGDDGCVYFWIRKEDLAARRFDRTWTVLQCY